LIPQKSPATDFLLTVIYYIIKLQNTAIKNRCTEEHVPKLSVCFSLIKYTHIKMAA